MSEETADNVAPVADNATPAQESTPVQGSTPSEQGRIEKFGELLSYASDDIKDAGTWSKFKDADMQTALKAIVDMDKWTGKRGDIPQADSTPEEWKEFWGKVGTPEDVAGYEYTIGDDTKVALGEEAEGLSQYVDHAKQIALKHNIPAKAMDGFLSEMMEHEMGLRGANAEAIEASSAAQEKILNDAWGESRPEMEASIKNLVANYGGGDDGGYSAETLILLGQIAKDLDENGQAGNAFSKTKIGLQDELGDVERQIQDILLETRGNVNDKRLGSLFERKRRLDHKLA